MAGTTGLEPAASAVTGQRSNQLNYVPTRINRLAENSEKVAIVDRSSANIRCVKTFLIVTERIEEWIASARERKLLTLTKRRRSGRMRGPKRFLRHFFWGLEVNQIRG